MGYPDNSELFRRMEQRKSSMTQAEKDAIWASMQPMLEAIRPVREKWQRERAEGLASNFLRA